MKPKNHLLRAILFSALLLTFASILVVFFRGALLNILTPLSERYRHEGDAFWAANHLPESILSYRQAVEADESSVKALLSLAQAYQAQGRLRMAQRYFERAKAVEPGSAMPSVETGQTSQALWIAAGEPSVPTGGAFADGLLVAAYEDGSLLAVNTLDGSTRWQVQLASPLTSAPVSDGRLVFVGDEQGVLHALRLEDGVPAWTFDTGGAIYAAPLVAGERVYCPSSSRTIFALNRQDGALSWKWTTSGGLNGTPALANGKLYLGSNNGRLYALDASSGAGLWRDGILTNGAVESQPLVADGRVVFGSGDSRVYSLAADLGGQYWRYSTSDAVFARPLLTDAGVLVASSGGTLSLINFLDGKPVWKTALPAALRSAPLVWDHCIYQLGEANSNLFVLDLQTGELITSIATGDWTAAGPWIDGSRIYLLGKDGAILAFSLPR